MRAVLVCLALVACGDNLAPGGPFDSLPKDGDFREPSLSAPVHVARDRFGIAHISADTIADAAFVQGYVMAHDRLPQMDILRRFGAGTLAELFGALDPSVIDTDLSMRVHRMTFYAQQTWDMLQASSDPTDQEIVQLLQRFSDGVNAYAGDLQSGKWKLDPQVSVSFGDPSLFAAWSPVDSLVLGRFQAFSLSYSTPFETDLTELYQDLQDTFDNAPASSPALHARAGISRDLMTVAPVGTSPTIDGFPNVDTDTGTTSDGGRPGHRAAVAKPTRPACERSEQLRTAEPSARRSIADGPRCGGRPRVPKELFANARRFLSKDIHDGPLHALGPHAFQRPWAGSNNWAVGPTLANGKTLFATDQHLQLPNPSIFYPMHLIVKDQLDVEGVTFPGIPGIILGSNGNVAWAATVSEHDVNDVYLEQIASCGAGDCVAFDGQQVPIQTFTETINIGALNTITDSKTVTYEFVPHHGPFIPTIDTTNHTLVPRTGDSALSVRYTGYDPTFEIRALYNLSHAKIVDDGFKALADFTYGSQNWTMIDNSGNIAWTTQALVPWRSPATYAWDPVTNPDGPAPFLVLPGDGSTEWEGRMDSRYVPHAVDPDQGYLATANADPVGATFDNNALNQPVVDGSPLYAGVTYDSGFREDRITTLIEATQGATIDDMSTIQHDTHSTVGTTFLPQVDAAMATLDDPTGAPSDVATFVAGLAPADKTRLETAKGLLAAWTGATPTALDAPDADAAATCLVNMWMHFFFIRTLQDEFTAAGFDMGRVDDQQLVRIVNKMLRDPGSFVQDAATGQPILCDDLASAGDDSCTKQVLAAMLDAMTQLETQFGSGDTTTWRWGKLHTLTITPLFPNTQLDLPTPDEGTGFPKAGDNFVINRSDMGWADTDFSQFADGPAQRFLAEAGPGEPIQVKWALPGGTIYDSTSPHYRDLLDTYYLPLQHFDAAFSIDEIVAAGESREEFHP